MPTPECQGSKSPSSFLLQISVDRLKRAKQRNRLRKMRTVPTAVHTSAVKQAGFWTILHSHTLNPFVFSYLHVLLSNDFTDIPWDRDPGLACHPFLTMPLINACCVTLCVCFRDICHLVPCEGNVVLMLQMISPRSQVDVISLVPWTALFPL